MFRMFQKKKSQEPLFIYRIEDTFAMKSGDCVVTGQVVQGSAGVNDTVWYMDARGTRQFCVVISGIEYGREGMKKTAKVNPSGTYGSHYGILIKGYPKEMFEIGGTLQAGDC